MIRSRLVRLAGRLRARAADRWASAPWRPLRPPALPPGAEAALRSMPPVRRYRDLLALPPQGVEDQVVRGGPLWPDWDEPAPGRLLRHGRPIDRPPEPPRAGARAPCRLRRPVVWGGFALEHFGHFVAESAPRLLQGRLEAPGAAVLMLPLPGRAPRALPRHVWEVLGWFGVPPGDVICLDRALRLDRCLAAPQAESVGRAAPPEPYLELLAINARARGLRPRPARVRYVSRAGLAARGRGHHAGEAYLNRRLAAAGVEVLHPERMPLRAQMEAYAGAERLVFAEGSALHGRQLLGRLDQEIHVLVRRPGFRLAEAQLAPRASSLAYAEVSRGLLRSVDRGGALRLASALSVCCPRALRDAWRALGVDLDAGWSDAEFEEARDADIREWWAIRRSHRSADPQASAAQVAADLDALGLSHLIREVA